MGYGGEKSLLFCPVLQILPWGVYSSKLLLGNTMQKEQKYPHMQSEIAEKGGNSVNKRLKESSSDFCLNIDQAGTAPDIPLAKISFFPHLGVDGVEERGDELGRVGLEEDLHLLLHRGAQLGQRLLLLDQRDHVLGQRRRVRVASESINLANIMLKKSLIDDHSAEIMRNVVLTW